MWLDNPTDDAGNARVDFVWGNVPPATLDGRVNFRMPGDGESEYFLGGYYDGYKPSLMLAGGDNHIFQLGAWNGYPASEPETGINFTSEDYNWVSGTRPAIVLPNCIGLPLEQAQHGLRNLGIAEDVTREFLSTNENPYDMTDVDVNTGDNVLQFGNVIYLYQDPEAPLDFVSFGGVVSGTHWDGRPWLGKEAEGLVVGMYDYPGFSLVPIDADEPEVFLYGKWLAWTLVVITNDPTKDQWSWWN